MTSLKKLALCGLLSGALMPQLGCNSTTPAASSTSASDTPISPVLTVASLKDGVSQFNTKVAATKFKPSSSLMALSNPEFESFSISNMDTSLWSTGGLMTWVSTDADPTSSTNTWRKKSYILCILAIITDGLTRDADGIHPQNGTYSVPITQAMSDTSVTICGSGGLQSMIGGNFPLTISTPSDTTYYKKNFTSSQMGSDTYMFGFSSTAIRFSFAEVNHSQSISNSTYTIGNRSVGEMTPDGLIKFEYASVGAASGGKLMTNIMRFAHSDSEDLTHEYSYYYTNSSGSPSNFSYTLGGKPTAGGTIALVFNANNMQATGVNSSNAVNATDAAICLTPSTWAIASNDTLSCGATGVSAASTDTAIGSTVATTFTDFSLSTYTPSLTAHLTWEIDNIFTTAPVEN